MKRIPFEDVYNLRDLGGIPISKYLETKSHQFLRADALVNLTEEEKAYLKDYGVKVIIDLRNDGEVSKRPNILENDPNFKYFKLPFLNEANLNDKADNYQSGLASKTLLGIYHDIIDHHQDQIKEFFKIVIKYKDDGILYHCSAGKDRTGMISMLILMLASVNKLDIMADYEVSFTYLLPRLWMLKKVYPNLMMHIMEAKPEYISEMVDYINDKYEGIKNYLKVVGLTEEEIEILKHKIA